MGSPSTSTPKAFLLTEVLLLLLLLLVSPPVSVGLTSVHDLLVAYGLPAGLLPRSVKSYTMDHGTGLLEVRLYQPCYVEYDDMVLFDQVVRGNLSYGGLRSVEGLSHEELFLWFRVRAILVTDPSSGLIILDIGAAHKHLPLSLFESPPDCLPGGGLLDGLDGRKDKWFHEQR